MGRPEEFPVFTEFWLERPARDSDVLTTYALLDSKSLTGAYRFDIHPGSTLVMNVSSALYPRASIERLGIAPLTSMFYQGDSDRRPDADWRPQIHDSDGLAMWSGSGEWIWRPLANPRTVRFSAYQDHGPRGFGLLQRDHNFDHYQDDAAFYDKRPSAWVEPRSNWGKGSLQLIELPAEDETVDNIVAFWNPAEAPQPARSCSTTIGCTGEARLRSTRTSPKSSRRATASAASAASSGRISRGASSSTSPAAAYR